MIEAVQQTEMSACPLCETNDSEQTAFSDGTVGVVRCRACQCWFLSPRLTEEAMIERYQDDRYFEGGESGYTSYRRQERSLTATFERLLRELQQRAMTGGRLLDVGCGYGYFLKEARSYFDQQFGTDFSTQAAREAGTYADEIYHGGPDQVPGDARFDLITALHVIEHVYHPHAFVQSLKSRLAPGGWLLLAAPDMGSFWRKLMGRRWPSFKYPEHVVFYDDASLQRVFEANGFVDLQVVPYPHAFPLQDVCAKFRIPVPSRLAGLNMWFPATTIAVAGRRPAVEES